ncbi:hypothetical protein CPB86DRAFT_844605 [Serendipita vermifera]|nr:hypothetical protein CPB86DRAFT_844605 [Serendipita vermifera]
MSKKYNGFRLINSHQSITIPSNDKTKVISVRLEKYEGIPLEGLPDGKKFAYLGLPSRAFLLFEDAIRYLELDEREKLWDEINKFEQNGGDVIKYMPFPMWDHKGKAKEYPPNRLFPDTRLGYTKETYCDELLKLWVACWRVMEKATPQVGWSVYSRFHDPEKATEIKLTLTPPEFPGQFKLDELKNVFKDLTGLPEHIEVEFMSYDNASALNQKGGLVLLSYHFFSFYWTWVSPQDFQKLCSDRGVKDLNRPWPTEQQAGKIYTDLKENSSGLQDDPEDTFDVNIGYQKMAAVAGTERHPDQKGVMGGTSATEIAESLWGIKDPPKMRPTSAEWLHRSAFRFGGLEDEGKPNSSQVRRNLIFGTSECNTHMIRAENAITMLLAMKTKGDGTRGHKGTLTTTNVREGKASRWKMDGKTEEKDIDGWVKQKKYMWLCMQLKYQWTTKSDKDNKYTLHGTQSYDPFSRYLPLLLEARFDDALMDYLAERPLSTGTGKHLTNFFKRSIPTLEPSLPQADAESTRLWQAANAGVSSMAIRGIRLSEPKVAQPPTIPDTPLNADIPTSGSLIHTPLITRSRNLARRGAGEMLPIVLAPDSLPPPQGFLVVGNIDLFGVSAVKAQLEVWQGPAPAGITVQPNKPAAFERATIGGDLRLSTLIPRLSGSEYDRVTFRNVTFMHQNYLFDKTKAIGWNLSADLVIDASAGVIHDVLSRVLNVEEPVLKISANFGENWGWNQPLDVGGFTLEGVFAGVDATPVKGVHLTTIGIRLFGIPSVEYEPVPHTVLEYAYSVFGSMNLHISGLAVPVEIDYEIMADNYGLYISGDVPNGIWGDACGVKGLELHNVSFSTALPLQSPWESFSMDVSAEFAHEMTSIVLEGSYAAGGEFSLRAEVDNFDMNTVSDVFESMTHDSVNIPDIDIKIASASLSIASGTGLEIKLKDVNVAGHTSANATLAINSTNVLIRGDLTSDVIAFGDVQVRKAYLQVKLESGKSTHGKRVDTIVGGEVEFVGLTFEAAVHLYPSSDENKGTEWTVLAALTSGNDTFALSKIASELDGTPFNLALSQVVFVAASKDDPDLGQMITSGYTFQQGVQICATLSEIPVLNDLVRGAVPGLILNASWSKDAGFKLRVALPNPMTLDLGNGIRTTPMALSIDTKPPQLSVSAGVEVPVAHSLTPLTFTFSLGANVIEAKATGEMKGWWVNPLGLSEKVKIGPNLALSVEIIFAQFVSTGTPSGFGIRGGLMIGNAEAQFALNVSEDPMREVLLAEAHNLGLTDLVSFAGDVTNTAIPSPPEDLLLFEELKIYICPTGMTLGSETYPQGFSFLAKMIVFGAHADIACAIVGNQVTIKGGVDNLQLGPLSVQGTKGPRAIVDCAFGPSAQSVLIDGMISFFDVESLIQLEVNWVPNPKVAFTTSLSFTDLLKFQLSAELIGTVKYDTLTDADFAFDALLEQHIIQYIHDQIILQFDRARQAAQEGIDSAQAKVDEAQQAVDDGITKAQADVDAAFAAWETKRTTVTAESQQVIDAYNANITRLQGDIDNAQKEYSQAMESAQQAVTSAQNARARAMADAQHEVDNAQRKMVANIADAQRAVDEAEADMNRQFGSAQSAVEDARSNVQSLQDQIDDLQREIDDNSDAEFWEIWKHGETAGLEAAKLALIASKETADGVLQLAQAVLTSSEFLGAQAALNSARGALSVAQAGGFVALDQAKNSLEAADVASQATLEASKATLKGVESGTEFVALEGAKQALELYKQANTAAYEAALAAIDSLVQSAEYLAYRAATGALVVARGATTSLEAAKSALEVVRQSTFAALHVGEWVFSHLTEAFDIQVVRLSGSLRGMIGEEGKISKPLSAHVEGLISGNHFTLDGEFDPRQTSELITTIFKRIWSEVESITGVNAA